MSFQPPKLPMPPVRDPRKIAQARVQQKITPLKNPRYVIPLAAVAIAGIAGGVARWLSGNWITVVLFVLAVLFAGLLAWLVYMVLSRERSQRLERGIGDEGAVAERRSSESVRGCSLSVRSSVITRSISSPTALLAQPAYIVMDPASR